MAPELTYLAWTALLTAVLWVPYIVGQVMTNGFLSGENYTDPTPRPVPLWVQRANRAHINAVEVFAPFAALIVFAAPGTGMPAGTISYSAVIVWPAPSSPASLLSSRKSRAASCRLA